MDDKISKLQSFRQKSFGFLIQVISRRMEKNLIARLSEFDLDLKCFINLMELNKKDGISQRELGALIDFPEYTTSRIVDTMVEKGLVKRTPNPHSRRSVCIFLTDKGKKIAAHMPTLTLETNRIYLNRLTSNENDELVRLLRKAANIPQEGDPLL